MTELKVVSLFTGAGGLDYGFEAAGFRICLAIDSDPDCCKTLRESRQAWPVVNKSVGEVLAKEGNETMLDSAGLRAGDVDVLIGGPPCQPFSKSGYWVNGDAKRLKDHRAATLEEYMRCVEDILPEVFLLENVHGIAYSGQEEGFRYLREKTKKINQRQGTSYRLSWAVLNAADFGVPQKRKRFFLVGHRGGQEFVFPKETHAALGNNALLMATPESGTIFSYVTAWDAMGDLEDLEHDGELRVTGKWAELLPSIPEGENYLWHTNRKGGVSLFGWRTRYWSFLLKLAKNLPSWTIQAQPGPATGPFHWKNRRLSVKEMGRLQTFPEDIRFAGSSRSVQRQIGNAVPSLLAEVLARAIAQQFFNVEYLDPPVLAVEKRWPIPPLEPVQPVSDQYLHLVGDHPDHPGAGKGPGTLK